MNVAPSLHTKHLAAEICAASHWNRASALIFVVFLILLSPAPRAEEVVPTGDNPTAVQQIEFPSDIEAKLAKFFEILGAAKRQRIANEMRANFENVQKATGLDANRAKALQQSADQAVDHFMDSWQAAYFNKFRKCFPKMISEDIDRLIAGGACRWIPEQFENDRPEEEPAWTEGLRQTLSVKQMDVWLKTVNERHAAKVAMARALVDRHLESQNVEFRETLLKRSHAIQTILALPEAAAAPLDKLAKRTAEESTKRWGNTTVRWMVELSETSFRELLKGDNSGTYYAVLPEDRETQDRAWNDGLAKMLSAADLQLWHERSAELRAAHLQIYAAILVAELDQELAFTAGQREQLEPLALRLVQRAQISVRDSEIDPHFVALWWTARDVAKRATDGELGAILNADQVARWRRICNRPGPSSDLAQTSADGEELTPEQRADWQRESTSREDYANLAIARYLLARFDQIVNLDGEQRMKLESLVIPIVAANREKLSAQQSRDNEETPWYRLSYGLTQLTLIPKEELANILEKKQLELWADSDCMQAISRQASMSQFPQLPGSGTK